MNCSACGAENSAEQKFCNECAAPFKRRCAKCGYENPPTAKFCGECATALTSSVSKPTAAIPATPSVRVAPESTSPGALEGERKTVTALFADIKGSTELEQDLDPEEARAIVDPALKLMIEAVHRYDGYIVQSTGDGIFALFGAPVAHEDHPQRALYAALRMQEELKRYSARLRESGNLPLEARVGVNTGEVVVRSITTGEGHTEYTPIGHTANLASRMQALAPTGSTAISEQTRKFVEGYFTLKPLGPTRVKGVSEPVSVYEVTGLGALRTRLQQAAGRGFTKFVGRHREMDAMKVAAEQAWAGHGQIVAAMAEAGVGKSRLIFEFKATSAAGWMVLEAFSVSHGKASSYLSAMDLLHSYFEISSEEEARKRRERVNGKVLTLDRSLEDTLPYLFGLLGIVEGEDPLAQMDGQVKRRRTLDAIKRILLRESLNQPLMVIFEDLHWIDEETQALLNLLADSIGTAKFLLLVNYRPEYSHQWNSKTYYTQLRLDPLGKESADQMLSALLGDGGDLEPLKRLIIERTEGNPFFMEETVLVLFDEGALVRNGAVKLTRPLNQLKIPPTVQAILAARIDRLAADHKDLLQTLAVIGKEFELGLVRKVAANSEPELEPMLSQLQLAEFIYERPAVGDIEYTFKHALTHEVAYNSLLSERRKLLHERVANAIESVYAASLDEHLGDLARHYQRSANAHKAAQYALAAGQHAFRRAAYKDSIAYLDSGIQSLSALAPGPERDGLELKMLLAQWDSLVGVEGFGTHKVEAALNRAKELCASVGDNRQLWAVLNGGVVLHMAKSEFRIALELARELLDVAASSGDPAQEFGAHMSTALVSFFSGDFVSAREHFDKTLAICSGLSDAAAPELWLLGERNA